MQDLGNIAANFQKQVDSFATYQLNMFGVHVFGSIPRWTSLYSTASKYPANPTKMMGCVKTWTNIGIAFMNRKPNGMYNSAYRAQGMILYLVAVQTVTWYTFGWWHLVRNLDVWTKKPAHLRWSSNAVLKIAIGGKAWSMKGHIEQKVWSLTSCGGASLATRCSLTTYAVSKCAISLCALICKTNSL